ncbi:MAG TPA: HPF/RaiA family ribosome-associated protein [Allosphingosinicella sp.]
MNNRMYESGINPASTFSFLPPSYEKEGGPRIKSGVTAVPIATKCGTPALPSHSPLATSGEYTLFIQIHADNQVPSDNDRDTRLEEQIKQRLARFEGRITDVEVHMSDINGPRGGNADKRASMEARVNGIQPVAAIDEGDTYERAVIGAAKKVVRALDHQLGKLTDRKGH